MNELHQLNINNPELSGSSVLVIEKSFVGHDGLKLADPVVVLKIVGDRFFAPADTIIEMINEEMAK